VAAWGFGATNRVPAPPPPEELAGLRQRVGYRLIELDPSSRSVSKRHPETVCDLSGVAKGYAVDLVARGLVERGYGDFLVEVGGEMKAAGEREGGGPWQVAIERPEPERRSIFKLVKLADRALATSGDYRSYYDVNGLRFSHLIDPRSGRPVAHTLTSVSVVHPSAAHADALATGLGVLGASEGHRLAESQGFAAFFIVREPDGGLRGSSTTAFESLQSSRRRD
jgi:thiamine biosynthesis lipoprotein